MFGHKPHLVVAITTMDLDALRVSLPPLRRLRQKFTLVIHNDNPVMQLGRGMVRRMYPRGKLHIINTDQNLGELESRIKTIEYIRDNKIPCDWIIFADDDDVLIDVGIPSVGENIFAIVQDATTIYESLTDIFKISNKWTLGAPVGKTGPHFDITGTMIRAKILFEFAEFMRGIIPDADKLLANTKYRVPISTLLWAGLNAFARVRHPDMSAIYMNRTNYVAIKMGRATTKYGRTIPNNTTAHKAISETIKKFTGLIDTVAAQNIVAENQ
ncbi:MAG: hypothetical protein J5620_01260 [Alphaproteobacteria bacterium]|nr:hypothetical protein [Alphaproteobacteria bacterium]